MALALVAVAATAACDDDGDESVTTTAPAADTPRAAAPATDGDPTFLQQYAVTMRFQLGHPTHFRWTPDGETLLFLRSAPQSPVQDLYSFDPASGTERVLLTAEQILRGTEEALSAEERARRERMRMTSRGIAGFDLSPDGATLLVPLSGRLFLVDRARAGAEGAVRELVSTATGFPVDARFSPDGRRIAVVRDGDLYVLDVASGAERRITTRPGDHVENGTAEFVAQEEMSRYEGYWWSPDSQTLLFQQTDTSGMERMHILDPMHPESAPHEWPYPRPGMANAVVRLFVVPATGGAPQPVEWDRERYPYLASVRWDAGAPITLVVQARSQQSEAVLAVDPTTRAVTELFVETDDAWLNLDQEVPRWIANGAELLFSTEREGEWQLEVRGRDGARLRAVTPPALRYAELLHVDETAGVAWIAGGPNPTEQHVYRVRLDGTGEPEAMTEGAAIHEAVVASAGGRWVEVRRPLDGDRTSVVRGADGAEIARVRHTAEAPAVTPNITLEEVGEARFRAAIVRPHGFDASRRYPVLVHVYGGPGVRYVTAERDRWLLNQWYADHGFIVVTFDGRGTPRRGRAWERAIREDFISAPLDDQVAALSALGAAHPELDLDRVGIYGWSFGGYFSAMAVLRRPDVFRCGVAGAPVSEWRDYDTHYTERYLGLPEAAGADGAYRRSSVLTYAEAAGEQRPLLIVHGTADDNVYFSHALKLSDALFRAGREHELLPLSGLTHMVPEPLITRRLQERMVSFFRRCLQTD